MSALARALTRAKAELVVRDLSVEFQTRNGPVRALDQVSFTVRAGETVALVGESGSGKSVASLTIMGLLDKNGRVAGGTVTCAGHTLAEVGVKPPEASGLVLAMVFQYPRTALNPIRRIGDQLTDVITAHTDLRGKAARAEAVRVLTEVRIHQPEQRLSSYPFELSGGMCQRVLIAMALAKRPAFLFADEPTTGLDVLTQQSIMELIAEMRAKHAMGTLLVTHDLGLARDHSDRIVVMKRGVVVESKTTSELFADPEHPYTRDLIHSTPALSHDLAAFRARLSELSP
jgi:peptide/nickel transport system ATP-binding protein